MTSIRSIRKRGQRRMQDQISRRPFYRMAHALDVFFDQLKRGLEQAYSIAVELLQRQRTS